MKTTKKFEFRVYEISYSWCEDNERWYASKSDAVDHAEYDIREKVDEEQKNDWYNHHHTAVKAGAYAAEVWSYHMAVTLTRSLNEDGDVIYTHDGQEVNVDDVLELAKIADEENISDFAQPKLVKTIKNKRA